MMQAYKKKPTRRARFLAGIDRATPGKPLAQLIEPFYPKVAGAGRRPIGVPRMRRRYVVQRCFDLSDEGIEDAIYDSAAIRDFVGVDPNWGAAPDATTLTKFRHLLEVTKASARAKVEHPFHVVKNLSRYRKTRYRGLAKNTAQLFTLFGLANRVPAVRRLTVRTSRTCKVRKGGANLRRLGRRRDDYDGQFMICTFGPTNSTTADVGRPNRMKLQN